MDREESGDVETPKGGRTTTRSADPQAAQPAPRKAPKPLPPPADDFRAYPVSTAVNDPSNDGPELIREVET